MTIDMDCCFYCGHRASELTQIRIAVKPPNTPHRWKVVGVACNTCADKYETQIITTKQIIHEALKKQKLEIRDQLKGEIDEGLWVSLFNN